MLPTRFIPQLLALGLFASYSSCYDDSVAAAEATPKTEAGAAEAGGMPQPTAIHKELLQAVGSWEGTITMFMPGKPESSVPAKEEVVAVGGFWTHSRFSCDFMGAPYVGTGCVGYNEATKSYVGTWLDSMSSYLSVMKGEKDAKTGAVVMQWEAPNMEGVMTRQRSEIIRTTDSYTMTFYEGDGAGRKHMVIAMKRKKT